MATRLSIPRTSAEAERFLWHALDFAQISLLMNPVECDIASMLIHQRIDQLQGDQIEELQEAQQ